MIRIKNLVPFILLGMLSAPAWAAEGGFNIALPWDGNARFAFELHKGTRVWMSFKNKALTAEFAGRDKAVMVMNFDKGGAMDDDYFHEEFNLTTGDYNFDGLTDIAIVTSHGYGGVNVFKDIFLFDKKAGNFIRALRGACNIELDPAEKSLGTSARSGPRWYTSQYRFDGIKPWISQEGTWFAQDAEFTLKRSRDGRIISRGVTDTSKETTARALRKIGVKKARLFNQADEADETKMYLVEGDEVRILDFVEKDTGDWVKIRYEGKRRIEKWLRFFDVNWNIAAQ